MPADNTARLVAAAQRRHELTRSKAIRALRELERAGSQVSFQSVADAAGVSRSWLYTQPDLKAEIRRLREATPRAPRSASPRPRRRPTPHCCAAWKPRTSATANSPRRTGNSAANSPARSATNAPPEAPTRRRRDATLRQRSDHAEPAASRWRRRVEDTVHHTNPQVTAPNRNSAQDNQRVAQRPLPARDPGSRALVHRTDRAEVPVPGHPVPRPHRTRPGTMGDALEAGVERLRDQLRRPRHPQHHQLKINHTPGQLHQKSDSPPLAHDEHVIGRLSEHAGPALFLGAWPRQRRTHHAGRFAVRGGADPVAKSTRRRARVIEPRANHQAPAWQAERGSATTGSASQLNAPVPRRTVSVQGCRRASRAPRTSRRPCGSAAQYCPHHAVTGVPSDGEVSA